MSHDGISNAFLLLAYATPTHERISIAFLLLAYVTPWIVFYRSLRRLPFTFPQSCLYIIAQALTRFLWRTHLCNRLEVPPGQGALIVCNHRSSVDPFFIQTMLLRKSHWMVAKEYCIHPLFRWFLHQVEAIPVNRGGIDTASTKAAIRMASSGELVGVFPEGRINVTDQFMLPCRPGAVLIALKAGVPLIPCYIEGSPFGKAVWSPLFMPARVRVKFGRPIHVTDHADSDSDREVMVELMHRCIKAIAQLAGRADFEPQLAGKKWKPTAEEVAAAIATKEGRIRTRN